MECRTGDVGTRNGCNTICISAIESCLMELGCIPFNTLFAFLLKLCALAAHYLLFGAYDPYTIGFRLCLHSTASSNFLCMPKHASSAVPSITRPVSALIFSVCVSHANRLF